MKTTIMSAFSENIKKCRIDKGWSQEGAATSIREAGANNFSLKQLGSYEEGRARPKYETLLIICQVYGINDLKWFLSKKLQRST
jgi:transcriptional regulator with XRE-family HTH domain